MPFEKSSLSLIQYQAPNSISANRHNSRMTPVMRAALDDLEREFAELMSCKRGPQLSQEVERRIEVARQLLEISNSAS